MSIIVTADLTNEVFDINFTGDGVISAVNTTGIAFDNSVPIDTIRFYFGQMDATNMDSPNGWFDNILIQTAPPTAGGTQDQVSCLLLRAAARTALARHLRAPQPAGRRIGPSPAAVRAPRTPAAAEGGESCSV